MKSLIGFLFFLIAVNAHADPVIVAHRGASAYAPENTLPAFKLAWEMNADAIEGDFHLTKDGEIVCIHDFNVKKYTGIDKRVVDMTLAEMGELDAGAWLDPKWAGVKFPSLSEVLDTVPDSKQIFVEVKCGPEIVSKLVEQVKASGLRSEQVVFISFDEAVIERLKEAAPEHIANWLISVKKDERGRLNPRKGKLIGTLKSTRADGISTKANDVVDGDFVSYFLNRDYGYHGWTVDDPERAKELVGWGVESITTNKPDVILRAFGR